MESQLKTLLESEGLPELIPRFIEHDITGDILVTLTDQDLERIGVRALGDRRRLLRAFEAKKEHSSVLAWVDGGVLPVDSYLAAQRVPAFMISKQRVGVQEWELIKMWGTAHGYDIEGGHTGALEGSVTHVSWYNALKWCNARSEKEGLHPVYRMLGGIYRKGEFGRDGSEAITWNRSLRGYRLPLECEWEWAAREGILNYKGEPTAANGTGYSINGIGLCEMSGDLFDWCWDLDDSGPFRRMRGGNWRRGTEIMSFGYRASIPPDSISGVIGLRVAMDIEGEIVECKKPVASQGDGDG